MKKSRAEKGAIMVEAALYLPLVLCTVMALIYLALFNMQEYMLMFQAQRAGIVIARQEAWSGYSSFGMGAGTDIDFHWGEGNIPSADQIKTYYEQKNQNVGELYREIKGLVHAAGVPGGVSSDYTSQFLPAVKNATLLAIGESAIPEISVDYGLLGNNVKVTVTHSIPLPGVMKYLGFENDFSLYATSYTYSANPTEFVRNVDLAFDMTAYIFDKLGMSDKYNGIVERINKALDEIL